MGVKVWHDDIRPAPEGWVWVRTNAEARRVLTLNDVEEISLDHDLGLDSFTEEQITDDPELLFGRGTAFENGLHLVNWMIEQELVPKKVTIHSWNPDGARYMAIALNRGGYDCTISPYVIKRGV